MGGKQTNPNMGFHDFRNKWALICVFKLKNKYNENTSANAYPKGLIYLGVKMFIAFKEYPGKWLINIYLHIIYRRKFSKLEKTMYLVISGNASYVILFVSS